MYVIGHATILAKAPALAHAAVAMADVPQTAKTPVLVDVVEVVLVVVRLLIKVLAQALIT